MIEILDIRNLSKEYTVRNNQLKVLDNINIKVFKGEFLCILGPSGCGKTTLLKHIGGFEIPDSGEVIHENKKVLGPEAKRVMVFQDFNQLFPWKTVFQNVLFPLKKVRNKLSKKETTDIARKFLTLVKLEDFAHYYPHQLSGGMKQRVALARALALEPELLLMDEPFGSLDALTKSKLQNLLSDIWKATGVTIVFVTHDIQEAILLSDRIAVMHKLPGRIKEVIDNEISRPRNNLSSEFKEMYSTIYNLLENEE